VAISAHTAANTRKASSRAAPRRIDAATYPQAASAAAKERSMMTSRAKLDVVIGRSADWSTSIMRTAAMKLATAVTTVMSQAPRRTEAHNKASTDEASCLQYQPATLT